MTVAPCKYGPATAHSVPARSSVAVSLPAFSQIKVINTHGTQVVDFWALTDISPSTDYLSMSHTRGATFHLSPLPGDTLVTNHRRPILEFVSDTTAPQCTHDTLIAACDLTRYHQLGVPTDQYHANCSDNFRDALLRDLNLDLSDTYKTVPDPLNLFMNIPVHPRSPMTTDLAHSVTTAGGTISFEPTTCKAGDSVTFKALQDCIVVLSACPQDLVSINGKEPRDAQFIILPN